MTTNNRLAVTELQARQLALETHVGELREWLLALSASLPADQKSAVLTTLRADAASRLESMLHRTFPSLHPAESDMAAAILRDAYEELHRRTMEMVDPPG